MEKPTIEVVRRSENFDVKNVKLFEVTEKKEKGISMTSEMVTGFINTHEKLKAEKGFLPTVFVGHNSMMTSEGEAIGFFDNIRVIGNEVYVDFVNIFSDWYEKLKRYPYRSMEIIDGQITGIAVLGSNSPYFMSEPLRYSKDEKSKIETYFLPSYLPDDNRQEKGDEKASLYFISHNHSFMEFTKENFEKLNGIIADKDAQIAQFQKDNDDLKTKVEGHETEKAQAETFSQVSAKIDEFAKNGKIAFTSDTDKEDAKKFAASLPDEDARTKFYATLAKLVAVKNVTKTFGADGDGDGGDQDGGGDDADKKDPEKQEVAAQEKADEFMKSGKFTDRSLALREAYKVLKIVE